MLRMLKIGRPLNSKKNVFVLWTLNFGGAGGQSMLSSTSSCVLRGLKKVKLLYIVA